MGPKLCRITEKLADIKLNGNSGVALQIISNPIGILKLYDRFKEKRYFKLATILF